MKKNTKIGMIITTLAVTTLMVSGCSNTPKDKDTKDKDKTEQVSKQKNGYKNVAADGVYVIGKNGVVPTSEIKDDLPIIEIYSDPMCPGCQAFEHETSEYLDEMVSEGKVLLRYHPLRFLDASSSDGYSSRAAAYLSGAAEFAPKIAGKLSNAIFDEDFMPEEGPTYVSVTNADLDELFIGLGGTKEQAEKINKDLNANMLVAQEATNNVILSNKLKQQSPIGSLFTPFVIPNKAGEDNAQALEFQNEVPMLKTLKDAVEKIVK